jgi:FolB domain-containing protein
MDRLIIRDLAMRCIIGLGDEERREKQDVLVNVSLYADFRKACLSDRVEDSVDYRTLKKNILALVESSKFYLVEALAQAVADLCLAEPQVVRAEVAVEKPSALRFARSVGVEITRDQTREE